MLRTAGLVVALLVHADAQARTKLRPEHLEPERVEVERPASKPSEKRTATPAPRSAPAGRSSTSAREQCTRATELYVAGNFTEAAAVFKQVIATSGDYAPAYRGLGFVYQRLGFAAMAIASYRRYLALAPAAADTGSIEARLERLGGTR